MLTPTQLGALVIGPLAMIAGRLLLVPQDDQDFQSVLTQMTGQPTANGAGWFLTFVGCVLLIPASLALAGTFQDAFPRLSGVASIMIVFGWAGASTLPAGLLAAAEIAGHAPLPAVAAGLDAYNDGLFAGPAFLMTLIGTIGGVVLAAGLYRGGAVPKAAAVLFGLGTALTLATMGGPIRILLVAASTILLIGCAWSAIAVRRPALVQA